MVGVFMYSIYLLVTLSLLTAVTLSQLVIKLVYLDALCLSSDYKKSQLCSAILQREQLRLTTIVTFLTTFCALITKCIIYLACSTSIKKYPQHNQKFPGLLVAYCVSLPWILGWLISVQTMRTSRAKGKKLNTHNRQHSKLQLDRRKNIQGDKAYHKESW